MRGLIFGAAFAVIAIPAWAEDAALLLGVERYQTLGRFVGGTDVTDAERDLRDAGYGVDAQSNAQAADMRQTLQRFQVRSGDADRVVVALSGRFVTDGARTWMLSADAPKPAIFTVEQEAVSVESILKVMAAVQGQSILLIGYDDGEEDMYDAVLREGIGNLDIPQGVTVVMGDPRNVSRLIGQTIVNPNGDIIEAVRSSRNLTLQGFAPPALVMQRAQAPVVVDQPRPYVVDRVAETLQWRRAVSEDTVEAYRAYLAAFPNGTFVQEANAAIQTIVSEPNRAARLAEEALGLTREQRRSVQRDLSILNYNTRGVDGIFGNGTRAAVSNWQQQNGFSQTGYVTDEQVARINGQAARKSAQLEQEAAQEREAQLRRDRAYWEETGANGREPGLRSYLERYPDGVYADRATAMLAEIELGKQALAARADRDAWGTARSDDTIESYTRYLRSQPQGAFRGDAEARLAALQRDVSEASGAALARSVEESLGLNTLTRRIIEGRLTQLGFDPGPADGEFKNKTRRAIRQFQRSRNLTPTGYISQDALVQLLAWAGN